MQPITHGSILAVFFAATDLETINGAQWYEVAQNASGIMAHRYGISLHTVAGVIAALSPNNRWARNLSDADRLISAYILGGLDDALSVKTSTYGKNKAKALAILQGVPPLEALGGLKVRAFYGCIVGEDAVCVDGHAYAIWRGERISTSSAPKISSKLYAAISADYVKATNAINSVLDKQYKPFQIQAITWLAWRRLNNGERYGV